MTQNLTRLHRFQSNHAFLPFDIILSTSLAEVSKLDLLRFFDDRSANDDATQALI